MAGILQSTHQRLVGLDMQTLRDQSVLPALRAVLEGRDGLYEGPYSATTGPAQVWVALRTAPLFDKQGQVTGGMALVEEITERKRAEEEQMERVRLTTLAADVGNALTQGDALSGMLQQCAERMVQHLDLAFARIWTLDPTDKVLELQTSAGMYTHTDGLHRRVPVGQLKIGLIAQERRPHLTNQVIGDPRVPDQEWAQREGMVAFAGYPLIAEGRLVGVMAMFARHPLTDLAFERLMSIADSIALGIQQKRAKGALRRRNAYLVALQETSLDLISQFDLNTLLENIVKRAGQLMGTSAGYLDLVEPGTDQLKPMVGLGALTESLQFASKRGEGVAGTVWQTGQPLVIDDYDAWAGRIGGFSRSAIRAIIGVPLIAGTEILGVLGLAYDATTDRTFDQEAVELATQFARLATLAIENARLFATAQQELAERNQAEAKVHLTLAELSRSNAELEQFAYVASHDLQEPLRMVTSYLQLIERRYGDRLDGDAREFMGYAVDGANRMKALINDLLAYSRVGTHGKPFGAVDCATSLAQATANLRVAIAENAAVVTHDPLPTVTGDAGQLTQLFQNLIGNAIKFHGAEPPVVHVSACLGEGIRDRGLRPQSPIPNPQSPCWVFAVRDNGIGMAPQSFDRIFVIFQRLHLRDEYPGTGIGLAVCKKIVERHGGAIWVESAPGQGATFWFTIPA
jgi:signal transduction histidine kinase